MSNSSYILDDILSPTGSEEVDSLPESGSTSSTDEDYDLSDADREWRESLQQLELLLTMVLIPGIGKYFGRRFAYWGWGKYMEWKYPVNVVIGDHAAFRGAGVVGAALPL